MIERPELKFRRINTDLKSLLLGAFGATLLMAGVEWIVTLLSSPFPNQGIWQLFCLSVFLVALLVTVVGTISAAVLIAIWGLRRFAGLSEKPTADLAKNTSVISALLVTPLAVVIGRTLGVKISGLQFQDPKLSALLLSFSIVVVTLLLFAIVWHVISGLSNRLPTKLKSLSNTSVIGGATILGCLALFLWTKLSPSVEYVLPARILLVPVVIFWGWLLGNRAFKGRPKTLVALSLLTLAISVNGMLSRRNFPAVKGHVLAASPLLLVLSDKFQDATDWDGDGYSGFLGGNDCAPNNPKINPGAKEIIGNNQDENCDGKDGFTYRRPTIGSRTLPASFQKDWNVLLITVDTLRYDKMSFGGNKKRNLTPNINELLAARGISFNFANAPSPGTMGTMPALLTSKYFHSGVALEEFRNGKKVIPPKLKANNFLLAEMMKAAGYYNGAITSHYYFKDWGMEQGFDTYDNSLGEKRDPWRTSSHDTTDKSLSWIASNSHKKWFLWAHYIDPHGRYVNHPKYHYGESEEDKYDSEIAYTDEHVGRLLKELATIPGAEKTIVILTSDHGDAFKYDHGMINHGHSLYKELLHVPLVFSVPGLPPKVVEGPVSVMDVMPTLGDFIGYKYEDDAFEGQSLVPQLFSKQDAKYREVFAETNYPKKQRAIITNNYKLIYRMQRNHYELYDLEKDPREKKNIASKNATVRKELQEKLYGWLDRVVNVPDAEFNQSHRQLAATRLTTLPALNQVSKVVQFANQEIELRGVNTSKTAKKLKLSLFFRALKAVTTDWQIQVKCRDDKGKPYFSKNSLTLGGVYPTRFWRTSEFVLDLRELKIPSSAVIRQCAVKLSQIDGTVADSSGEVRDGFTEIIEFP